VVTLWNAWSSNQRRRNAFELLPTDRGLDPHQEQGAFRVRNAREAVVGVVTGEVEVQHLRQGSIRSISRRRSARGELHLHARALRAVDALHDPRLEVDGEAFVEPEVAPRRVGDQVARPRVRQLVRDQRHERLVARQTVGVAKVRRGFSMPPYGNDGGSTSTS
jgi:hypothetical protein